MRRGERLISGRIGRERGAARSRVIAQRSAPIRLAGAAGRRFFRPNQGKMLITDPARETIECGAGLGFVLRAFEARLNVSEKRQEIHLPLLRGPFDIGVFRQLHMARLFEIGNP